MNVVIVTSLTHPPVMALAQRIHLLAKSIAKEGCAVVVRSVSVSTTLAGAPGVTVIKELREGIEYEYSERKSRIAGRFGLHLEFLLSLMQAAQRTRLQSPRTDAVLLYMTYLPAIVLFKSVSQRTRAVYVTERTEYPYLDEGKTWTRKLLGRATVRLGYRLFDGMLVISRPLESVFRSLVGRRAQTMVVPILCDPPEFQISVRTRAPVDGTEDIVYAGGFSEQKDGFFTLIRSFAAIAAQRPQVRLTILGTPTVASDGVAAKQLVGELGLEGLVEFRGYVPRQEYVRLLASADLLVLAKPRNVQNDYCMPTKVAEYLMSGRPTLVTKCGVLAKELKDGENVFFAEPGSLEDFAKKMLWILDHKTSAERVGLAGREHAVRHYDHRIHGSRILAFLHHLGDSKIRRNPVAWQDRNVQNTLPV